MVLALTVESGQRMMMEASEQVSGTAISMKESKLGMDVGIRRRSFNVEYFFLLGTEGRGKAVQYNDTSPEFSCPAGFSTLRIK